MIKILDLLRWVMIFNSYAEGKESADGLTLVSCGHIFAKNGREIKRPSGRNDWLLFYVAKESETFYFDRKYEAKSGSFVLFAPGEKQHHVYSGNKTAEFYYVHFKCDKLPFSLNTSTVYELAFSRSICDTFEMIIDEVQRKQPNYERLCIYKLLSLLCELERTVGYEKTPSASRFDKVSAAVLHMNRYYNQSTTLEEYAVMCNMSKHHFLRVFESIVGESPLHYKNRIRLEHAAELLSDSAQSVSEISDEVGFSSPSYFCQAFKRYYGIAPKQYKKSIVS